MHVRSYILNRGWIDRTSKRLPTFAEVTGSRREKAPEATLDVQDNATPVDDKDLDQENDFDELAETFEHSYNFRFEEPYVLFHHLVNAR